MDEFNPSAQRQFLVKVSGIDDYFQTKTGGNQTADTTKVWPGGSTTPAIMASPADTENVTVTRAYDPYRDGPVLKRLRTRVGKERATVSVTPTDADMVPVDDPTVYANALLVGLNDPDADSSSGDAGMLELVWAVPSVR